MRKSICKWIACLFGIVILCFSIYTLHTFRKCTKEIDAADISSVRFDSYSDWKSIDNVRNPEIISDLVDLLKGARFCGFITESAIMRTEDKNYCFFDLAFADNKVYRIQVTPENADQCYISPIKGPLSEYIHIKIGDCSSLYDYVYTLILSNQ